MGRGGGGRERMTEEWGEEGGTDGPGWGRERMTEEWGEEGGTDGPGWGREGTYD